MSDSVIRCPKCGVEFEVSEALSARLRGNLETSIQRDAELWLRQAVQEAEARKKGEYDLLLKDLEAQLFEPDRLPRR